MGRHDRTSLWLCLALMGGATLWVSSSQGRDPAPANPAAGLQMIVRGPEEPQVGQRSTVEVFLINNGTTPVRDLELHAKLDAHLEQASKDRASRQTVPTLAPDDIQVVRLAVTPRKAGPGGIDFTLRAGGRAVEEVRQVWPVLPESATRQVDAGQGTGSLKFRITALKECLVDKTAVLLVQVTNTALTATGDKAELVVNYATMQQGGQMQLNPNLEEAPREQLLKLEGKGGRFPTLVTTNPTRQVPFTVPALAAGESLTIPVRVTARRIGDLGIAITRAAGEKPASQALATARVPVKIDPKLTREQLVPVRPGATVPTRLPATLADVPEVALEDPTPAGRADEGFEKVAALVEKINHVNKGKTDNYVEALVSQRSDLRGLPFVMGDACRLSPERGQNFVNELAHLRQAMANPGNLAGALPAAAGTPDLARHARIAALVQVTGPEGAQLGQQCVKYLASLKHADANKALANLAIFAEEEPIRTDALAALAECREQAVTDILVAGLSYPWPAVAQRAADAIVKLKRQDLIPQLVSVLDRADPRAPAVSEKAGKQVHTVRELVRINHLRNCLLCHSPADQAKAAAQLRGLQAAALETRGGMGRGGFVNTLTAPVALPNQALPTPTPSGGYGQFTIPDILASIDVTYLRQDFSVKLNVGNAKPWPDAQRFDFLVRTREVTTEEADAYRKLVQAAREGDLSPYQRAAVASLRELTGKDAAPNAAAWRQALAQK